MSHKVKSEKPLVLDSPKQYFADRVEEAAKRLKFDSLPASRAYLAELLHHFMFTHNLFTLDNETGKIKNETLAEMYLRAQNSPTPARTDLLKRLGDSSLYISGFFGDSLSRKLVDIDYYVDMGGTAYGELAVTMANGDSSQVFKEFSTRFAGFVDVLTYISQDARVQTNEDLLRLYDRYRATGSRLAEEALVEKGLLNADIQKGKINRM